MAAKERLEMIRQIIAAKQKVAVAELSDEFSVTEETIRRDLEKLERVGVLTRTFGGAVLNVTNQRDNLHYHKRAAINLKEKRKIAEAFSDVLNRKTTIAVDASTTTIEAVKLLKNSNGVTVLSNSTEIFRELAHTDISVISTGGVFNKQTLSLQGQLAKKNISKYHVEIALLSCNGLSIEEGAMDSNENEAEIKKQMLKQAAEVALLVDSSKFNKKAFMHLLDVKEINYLVTDIKPDGSWVQFCEDNHITLMY